MWTAVHHLQIQTAASGTQWHWVPVAPGGLNEFVSGRRCWLNTGALLSVFSQVGGQTGGGGVNNSSLLPALCMTFFFPRQKKAVVTFEKHERISGRIGFFRREEGMFRPRIDETHGWMCRASNGRRKKRIDYRDPMWCCTQFFLPPSPCVSGRFALLPLLCGRVWGRSKRRGKAVFGTPTPSTRQQGVWKTRTTSTTTSTSDKLGEADRKERGRSIQDIEPQVQLRRFHRCHWPAGWHSISFAVCIFLTAQEEALCKQASLE